MYLWSDYFKPLPLLPLCSKPALSLSWISIIASLLFSWFHDHHPSVYSPHRCQTISLKFKKKKAPIIPLIWSPQYLMYSQRAYQVPHVLSIQLLLRPDIPPLSAHSLRSVWPLGTCWTWLPSTSLRTFRLFSSAWNSFPQDLYTVHFFTSFSYLFIYLLGNAFLSTLFKFHTLPFPSIIPQHYPFLFCFSLAHRVVSSYP